MNKKGFTLVEILATISILGIIMIIVATKGFGAFDTTKKKITDMNKDAVIDAAKLLAVDIENCDDDLDQELVKSLIGAGENCQHLIYKYKNNSVQFNIGYLITKGYLEGDNISTENHGTILYISKNNINKELIIKSWDGNNITDDSKNLNWYE